MSFRKKKKPMETCLVVLLIIQVFLIVLSNLVLIEQYLDCDNAKLLKHIILMWQEKTIGIPQWTYTTTLEWDCTTLFALPLYGLTKNIYLACTVSNLAFVLILIRVIFFIFKDCEPLYPLLCANLICIPYRVGMLDYYNMLFFAGAQYIVKILIPLLLIGILLFAEQKKHLGRNRSFWLYSSFYLVLLAVSSASSGVYVAACGLVPILAVYLGYKFLKWERVSFPIFVLIGLSVLNVLMGMKVNERLMGGTRAESMVFCSVQQMLVNVSSCFFGLFELMGGNTAEPGVAVLSLDGIIMLSKCCLTVVLLVCGITAFIKCIKKQGDLRLILLLSVFIWNYFVLNITYVRAGSTTYEYRYHLMGMIPLICVAVVVILKWFRTLRMVQQKWMFVCAFSVLFIFCSLVFWELFARGEQNASLKELVSYMEDIEVDTVFMYDGGYDADICRLLDEDHLYLYVGDDGFTWVHDYYSKYVDTQMQTENAIVAVLDEEYDMGDSFEIGGHSMVRYDTVGGRSLYYFAD